MRNICLNSPHRSDDSFSVFISSTLHQRMCEKKHHREVREVGLYCTDHPTASGTSSQVIMMQLTKYLKSTNKKYVWDVLDVYTE